MDDKPAASLAELIMKRKVCENSVFVYWLGGAGFVIKNGRTVIGIDLYLSDACRNEKEEFKRLIPPPLTPDDLRLDCLIATHEHGDHFDVGSLHRFVSEKTETKLIGTNTVIKECQKLGIDGSRLLSLDRNESICLDEIKISGVFCDHGDQSPDAIGMIMEIEGKSIYFTGDTCYRPDLYKLIPLKEQIDLLLVPINGTFGNPDPKDASYITAWVRPKAVVPCHFWLFKEHGGDPGAFYKHCREIAPDTEIKILAIGEEFCLK